MASNATAPLIHGAHHHHENPQAADIELLLPQYGLWVAPEKVMNYASHVGRWFMDSKCLDWIFLLVWRYAFASFAILWSFWLVFPFVTYATSTCDEKGGMADGNFAVFLLFVPVLVATVALEQKCYAFLHPFQQRHLPPLRPFGFLIPFWMSHLFASSASVVAHLDIATSGFLVGRIFKTLHCPDQQVSGIWETTLQQSHVGIFFPTFDLLAIFSWIAMVSQPMFAIYAGFPLCGKSIEEERVHRRDLSILLSDPECLVPETAEETSKFKNHQPNIHTMQEHEVGMYDATMPVAQASRCNVLTLRNIALRKAVRGTHLGDPHRRRLWVVSLERAAFKTMAYLLLETCLIVNLQSTVLAVDKAAAGDIDGASLFSVSLSITVGFTGFVAAAIGGRERSLIVESARSQFGTEKGKEDSEEQLEQDMRRGQRAFLVLIATVVSGVLILAFTLGKTSMAYMCDDGVWNLFSNQYGNAGCVKLVKP